MFKRYLADERGAEMTEYILVVAVIAIAAIVALYFFRDQIIAAFQKLGTGIQESVGE